MHGTSTRPRTLVIACGALTREVRAVLAQVTGADQIVVEYLPANLHNRPEQIAPAVREMIEARRADFEHISVAYADCGTGGMLDAALAPLGIARLPGAHCYEFFAGSETFAALHDAEPGTFYLTDFLARHFEQLVLVGLGLDRYPHLRDTYFGNYRRLVLLSQTDNVDLVALATAAADRLGLAFEHRPTGMHPFGEQLKRLIPLRAG
jgi:Protein of unknown function (DUF1638)